ncbi:MAG: ribosome maturation factor RimM [Candidatus Competibacteraceae bacterium]|nr:ribosome maturation factor RimM [Candidatus Competibacteraceae bacterium]
MTGYAIGLARARKRPSGLLVCLKNSAGQPRKAVPTDPTPPSDWVVLGRVVGLYGISGWVKLFSHTQDRNDIFNYKPLYLGRDNDWQPQTLEEGRAQGKGIVAKFSGYDDRNKAVELLGQTIAVQRQQLATLAPGEYYWSDLIGLRVINQDDIEFGNIAYLFETGANDVIVVRNKQERLIPFIKGKIIVSIDLEQRVMRVNWDPQF